MHDGPDMRLARRRGQERGFLVDPGRLARPVKQFARLDRARSLRFRWATAVSVTARTSRG